MAAYLPSQLRKALQTYPYPVQLQCSQLVHSKVALQAHASGVVPKGEMKAVGCFHLMWKASKTQQSCSYRRCSEERGCEPELADLS